jgi:hypothetical protein
VVTALFSSEYTLIWAILLATALWMPLRHLIWVMSLRRMIRKNLPADEATQQRLKRRAGFTAALLALVFSIFYTDYLFRLVP